MLSLSHSVAVPATPPWRGIFALQWTWCQSLLIRLHKRRSRLSLAQLEEEEEEEEEDFPFNRLGGGGGSFHGCIQSWSDGHGLDEQDPGASMLPTGMTRRSRLPPQMTLML
jgi:hypothetical protein